MTGGVVVFAHGSRVESANQAVRAVTSELARQAPECDVESAFLEFGKPDLAGAVAALARRGHQRVIVLPYFLTLGTHLERDLPALIADISKSHNDLEITVAPPLDGHPDLSRILLDRLRGVK